ncbi:MAG: hypothetical protein WCP97_01470 [bacterium]
MEKKSIFPAISRFSALVNVLIPELYFFTGGVALRLYISSKTKQNPESCFRNHGDIDVLISSDGIERIIPTLLAQKHYRFIDSAYLGLQTTDNHSPVENHHYALYDRDYDVEFGIFEVIAEDDGIDYVYTNRYLNPHPKEVFHGNSIEIGKILLPLVSVEWLSHNASFYQSIRHNDDLALITPYCDEKKTQALRSQAIKKPVNYSTYVDWIEWRHYRRQHLFTNPFGKGEING